MPSLKLHDLNKLMTHFPVECLYLEFRLTKYGPHGYFEVRMSTGPVDSATRTGTTRIGTGLAPARLRWYPGQIRPGSAPPRAKLTFGYCDLRPGRAVSGPGLALATRWGRAGPSQAASPTALLVVEAQARQAVPA